MIKIETYWNVNHLESHDDYDVELIKIETYWNVNFSGEVLMAHGNELK